MGGLFEGEVIQEAEGGRQELRIKKIQAPESIPLAFLML